LPSNNLFFEKKKMKKTFFSFQSMPNLNFAGDFILSTKNHAKSFG